MKTISRHCPKCKKYASLEITKNSIDLNCPECKEKWGIIKNKEDIFDYCPCCPSRQFYTSKDFNQFLGCIIMAITIALVPVTYGLSLPVLALIDWLLRRKTPTIITCYRCAIEFKGFENNKNFKPFLNHIGLKYDKYR